MHAASFPAATPPLCLNLLVQINVTKSLLINVLWLLISGREAVSVQLPVEARRHWTGARKVQM